MVQQFWAPDRRGKENEVAEHFIVYDFIAKLPERAKASFIFTCRKINKEEKGEATENHEGKNYSWELGLH